MGGLCPDAVGPSELSFLRDVKSSKSESLSREMQETGDERVVLVQGMTTEIKTPERPLDANEGFVCIIVGAFRRWPPLPGSSSAFLSVTEKEGSVRGLCVHRAA